MFIDADIVRAQNANVHYEPITSSDLNGDTICKGDKDTHAKTVLSILVIPTYLYMTEPFFMSTLTANSLHTAHH